MIWRPTDGADYPRLSASTERRSFSLIGGQVLSSLWQTVATECSAGGEVEVDDADGGGW